MLRGLSSSYSEGEATGSTQRKKQRKSSPEPAELETQFPESVSIEQLLMAGKLAKAQQKDSSAFFKEFSPGGQNRKKKQNEKYEPSRFGERASLKRDFVKL
jgi:hypothetical protein